MGLPIQQSIFLSPVTEVELHRIIHELKTGASGCDEISASLLKYVSAAIIELLVYLCNMSLDQGIFPKELKLANVIPLYKAADPALFDNYRPVSLLCISSKTFKKVMYSRLTEYLELHRVLINNQFGFRKLHSSYMALMVLINELISSLEKGESVIGVFLYFSKAFDNVDHAILLCKLEHYGNRGCAFSWFKIYLTDREQFVTFNGVSSATKLILCGVPQGSILGPLLFLICINDLHTVCKNTFPILFADDTNLFTTGTDFDVMQNTLNDELNEISTWLKVNKLSLNVKKLTIWVLPERKCVKNLLLWKSMVKTLVKSWKQNS